jgi:DNA ligase-1
MLYDVLVKYYEKLEATTKRLEMINILTELFQNSSSTEIDKIVYLTQGKIHPDWTGEPEIGMAEKMVIETIVKASGIKKAEIENILKEKGDIGLTAEDAIKSKKQNSFFSKNLTVSDIYRGLDDISKRSGKGSSKQKIESLSSLLIDSSPNGARYLSRMVVGKLRLGIGDMTILDALAQAFTGDKKNRSVLERAYNISSDLGLVAEILTNEGLEALTELNVRVGSPIRVMAAQRLSTAKEVIEKLGGRCSAEYKLDGERFQIHKKGEDIQIFSRRLENITHMYPDAVELTLKNINADEAIIEGEAVAMDLRTGDDLPFQTLMQRRRKYKIEEMMEKIPIRIYLFDCLYYNGKDLTRNAYPKRIEALEKITIQIDQFKLVERLITSDPKELEIFLQNAISEGTEGLVIKSTSNDSIYRAGARSWLWVKLKRSYQSKMQDHADLVIVGAFYGRGRRAGTYGALLVAAYNRDSDTFQTVCKVGSGLTDENLAKIPDKLDPYRLDHKSSRVETFMNAEVWFDPKVVMEVLGDEITLSPLHTAAFNEVQEGVGLAIRFPRFTRWRDDKSIEEITTVNEIVQMFKSTRIQSK